MNTVNGEKVVNKLRIIGTIKATRVMTIMTSIRKQKTRPRTTKQQE